MWIPVTFKDFRLKFRWKIVFLKWNPVTFKDFRLKIWWHSKLYEPQKVIFMFFIFHSGTIRILILKTKKIKLSPSLNVEIFKLSMVCRLETHSIWFHKRPPHVIKLVSGQNLWYVDWMVDKWPKSWNYTHRQLLRTNNSILAEKRMEEWSLLFILCNDKSSFYLFELQTFCAKC